MCLIFQHKTSKLINKDNFNESLTFFLHTGVTALFVPANFNLMFQGAKYYSDVTKPNKFYNRFVTALLIGSL